MSKLVEFSEDMDVIRIQKTLDSKFRGLRLSSQIGGTLNPANGKNLSEELEIFTIRKGEREEDTPTLILRKDYEEGWSFIVISPYLNSGDYLREVSYKIEEAIKCFLIFFNLLP
jgi:hypothetical protein